MKRSTAQIFLATVCAILGFLIIYQIKSTISKEGSRYNTANIMNDIQVLKRDKEELSAINEELGKKLKEIEEKAIEENAQGNDIKNELYAERVNLGLVDVIGDGIRINIKFKGTMFNSTTKEANKVLEENELVKFLGFLWFGGAEAISINDMRLTPQTGMNTSGADILIGSAGKINPSEDIIIEVIGDAERIKKNLSEEYGGASTNYGLNNYNVNIEDAKDIKIGKTIESIHSEHLSPVINE